LLRGSRHALLAVTPLSGRTHQIRRHLEGIGHPVLGDKRYGGGELSGLSGFALHSFRTAIVRPDGGPLTVCAPLPAELLRLCEQQGLTAEMVFGAVSAGLAGHTANDREVTP
jgi:hypothetical protein